MKLVERRINRTTRATISLRDGQGEYANPKTEGGRWITLCETHGNLVNHETRALARSWMAEPQTWCEECSRIWREQQE